MLRAEVVKTKGWPVLHINGEPRTGYAFCATANDLSSDRAAAARRIAEFRDAGIHYYTFGLGLGPFMGQKGFWNGPGVYDFAVLDDLFGFVLSIDKDARMLPRIGLDGPAWWKAAHPDDIAVGWSAERGYFKEDWLQSFSSTAWRQDAGAALESYIRHAEKNFSENIFGYHVCAEASHEWSYGWWGTLHDYGPAQVRAFREWLKARHNGDVTRLRAAWKDEPATFDGAQIPGGESRRMGDYFEYFDPARGTQRIEYLEFHNQTVADAIRHFASIAKAACGRQKLCGVFYGYYFFSENALLLDVGHRALEHVLASPDVDFIACPYNYRERQAGGAAIPQMVAGAIALSGKLCYIEDDTRTCLAPRDSGWGDAATLDDTIEILKRNFALAATNGHSLWWMEQSPGWYSAPELLQTIRSLETLGLGILQARTRAELNATEIAVFVSDESARYMRYNTSLIEPSINEFCVEQLPRLGAPHEAFLVSDLERLAGEGKLDRYKLVLFLNAPFLSAAQRKIIRENLARGGRTILWLGCPGYISETGLALENMAALTGMEFMDDGFAGVVHLAVTDFEHPITREMPRNVLFGTHQPTGPLVWCSDQNARHLGEQYAMPALGKDWRWRTGMFAGKTGLAVKEMDTWRSVWCGVPNLPSALLRGIAKAAGVHVYVDSDDVVYASQNLLAVHTRYAGTRQVALPGSCTVLDAITREPVGRNVRTFELRMERGKTGMWLLE